MTETLAKYITARDSFTDYVVGAPTVVNPDEDVLGKENTEIPVWNLRPVRELRFPAGAGAREMERVRHLLNVGAIAIGILDGGGTIVTDYQGLTSEVNFVACKPIPMREMAPNATHDFKGEFELSDFVTPLLPVGKRIFHLKK